MDEGAGRAARGRFELRVRWSDVDLFGHVNNGAFLRYLDDARFAVLPTMGVDATGRLTDTMLVVVKHEIDYVAPAPFRPEPLAVELWVPRIGRTSVDIAYEVLDATGDAPATYVRALSRMVQVEALTQAPRAFDEEQRGLLGAWSGPGPVLRGW
ncbi:acyl-CoA thioesterase [Cellulomonas marina]|uniref:Acyl-CoA thioester hydrolase n=1 Tax=Cellulomonas marina TaxID=988821 RepID=A0A1I0WUR7_9CELL|nr:acyl-CoA thioesterase [Cellulomonas marina]GIG30317.1 thioesterase [Cellulomonas marina]SFA91766.1 acyl-CoA thioester hydrolase [Cellulomonas marina]